MIYVADQRRRAIVAIESLAPGAAWQSLSPTPDVGPLDQPSGLAVSADGRLAIADYGNARVVVLDLSDMTWTSLAPAPTNIGRLLHPTSVAFAADGSLLIADQGNRRIVRASSLDLPEWTRYGQPGTMSPGGFVAPTGVAVDADGRIIIADPGARRLIAIEDMTGAGWTELALPLGNRPVRPYAIVHAPDVGSLLISDLINSRIVEITSDNVTRVRLDARVSGAFVAPVAICAAAAGVLVVADAATARLTEWQLDEEADRWEQTGQLVGVPGPQGGPEFSRLCGLAVQPS